MRFQSRSVVLATGGSGGHLFAAKAVAVVLATRGYKPILFTDRRGAGFNQTQSAAFDQSDSFENNVRPDILPVCYIPASSPMQGGLCAKIGATLLLGYGTLRAIFLLLRLRPATVIGFGGYAFVPTGLASLICRIPLVLHEQNAILGRANRLLARWATVISYGLVRPKGISDGSVCAFVGNPVRSAVAEVAQRLYVPPNAEGLFSLFVMGGSQGAAIFSDIIPQALAFLPEALRVRLDLVQQCRAEDLKKLHMVYTDLGIHACLSPFFIDAPQRLAQCHLAITRAGASTLSELTIIGVPVLLIPYPHATDDHQTKNARWAQAGKGAEILFQTSSPEEPELKFTPACLAERLSDLLQDPECLQARAAAMRALSRPRAAERLSDIAIHGHYSSSGSE